MPHEVSMKQLAVRSYSMYSVLICTLIAALPILGLCSNSSNEPERARESAEYQVSPQQPKGALFYVSSYLGKCLDFGAPPQTAGAPVYLYPCNSTAAQQVGVEEINRRHEVVLHTGNLVIGVHNPPTHTMGGPPAPPPSEYSLELQPEANRITSTLANQVFALDGDSIIWTANRN